MRISENSNMESLTVSKPTISNSVKNNSVVQQGSEITGKAQTAPAEKTQSLALDNSEETKAKVQEAVNKLNDMLSVNNSASKFLFHEGLERYYVTMIDRETEEVIKEIPPKRLLDAYYEMQKMLGMIVDEKI